LRMKLANSRQCHFAHARAQSHRGL
jgi:hypothetical protein